jgi:hypothetical protein
MSYIIEEYLGRYDEASVEVKPYRQKDGALLAIGTLCDRLKQTDAYKAELERMLVQHVFPEFSSQVGHLRAKVVLPSISCYSLDLQIMYTICLRICISELPLSFYLNYCHL